MGTEVFENRGVDVDMDTEFFENRGVDMDMDTKFFEKRGVDMDMDTKFLEKRGVDLDMDTVWNRCPPNSALQHRNRGFWIHWEQSLNLVLMEGSSIESLISSL